MAIDGIRDRISSGKEVPDILFLDINMPIMDGWQFLEEFISIPIEKSVRINIVTSSIDPLDQKNWLYFKEKTHHHIDFKQKPIRQKDIEEITRAA
jgi:CheY-like chemotaxis protein